MYVGPQVGSLVDLQREPRRCQEHRVAVPEFTKTSAMLGGLRHCGLESRPSHRPPIQA
jgi:hypothetical protein